MDMEMQLNLAKSYSEKSDEEIRALLQSGRDSFEEEAYDILLKESRRRGFDERGQHDIARTQRPIGETPLGAMNQGEILDLTKVNGKDWSLIGLPAVASAKSPPTLKLRRTAFAFSWENSCYKK